MPTSRKMRKDGKVIYIPKSESGKASSGVSEKAIKNALAGNKVDLDYALMKRSEYGNIKGGGTKKTREAFEMWNDEVKRLQEERRTLESVPSEYFKRNY